MVARIVADIERVIEEFEDSFGAGEGLGGFGDDLDDGLGLGGEAVEESSEDPESSQRDSPPAPPAPTTRPKP